ncbi:hypothetical protein EYF80_041699 [Liparis tanakae]|uniref:Uncharacterized protein n=1 Tax=Liparis tanakae TaxID=230148 RepID=A0A4Z2G5M5_9TELE|nr:hypothetical protein EYF80_041699 [Liparis tanakae]
MSLVCRFDKFGENHQRLVRLRQSGPREGRHRVPLTPRWMVTSDPPAGLLVSDERYYSLKAKRRGSVTRRFKVWRINSPVPRQP